MSDVLSPDVKEAVGKCFAFDDNDQAFKCLQDVIVKAQQKQGDCNPKFVLLTQENCSYCTEEKTARQTEINTGLVEVVNIHSQRGTEIAKRNGIDFVPALLLVDCQDNIIE